MANEMLDILITKYLDSEITPSEQRLLDDMLACDPEARQYLDELTQLQALTSQTLTDELDQINLTASQAFDNAAQQLDRPHFSLRRYWRQFTGIAAALAIGLVVGLITARAPQTTTVNNPNPADTPLTAQADTAASTTQGVPIVSDDFIIVRDEPSQIADAQLLRRWTDTRNNPDAPRRYVEYYTYPDTSRPASNSDDLRTVDY